MSIRPGRAFGMAFDKGPPGVVRSDTIFGAGLLNRIARVVEKGHITPPRNPQIPANGLALAFEQIEDGLIDVKLAQALVIALPL